jgi:hypothetical protein
MMPAWQPGKQNGKNVNVQLNMPVNFTFYNSKKSKETTD